MMIKDIPNDTLLENCYDVYVKSLFSIGQKGNPDDNAANAKILYNDLRRRYSNFHWHDVEQSFDDGIRSDEFKSFVICAREWNKWLWKRKIFNNKKQIALNQKNNQLLLEQSNKSKHDQIKKEFVKSCIYDPYNENDFESIKDTSSNYIYDYIKPFADLSSEIKDEILEKAKKAINAELSIIRDKKAKQKQLKNISNLIKMRARKLYIVKWFTELKKQKAEIEKIIQ